MTWLVYALSTCALWTLWAFLGKLSLRSATPIQATIVFGAAAVAVGIVSVLLGQRTSSWSPGTLWLTVTADCAERPVW